MRGSGPDLYRSIWQSGQTSGLSRTLQDTQRCQQSHTHPRHLCVRYVHQYHHDNIERNNTGDSDEAQILVAGQRYLDRPAVLETILNDLFHVFRYETCQNTEAALDILLLAMEG